MPGCDFTRRDFLRWSGVALASPLFARSALLSDGGAPSTRGDAVSPANLELVTLTEDRAIITWYSGYTGTDDGLGRMQPAPADGVVDWGTSPKRLNRVAGGRRETPYHYVELTGLEPGQTYYYQARSNGKPVPPTPFTLIDGNAVGTSDFGLATGGPYRFTVPKPPPGRFLFSIALCNDLHMGETTAGLAGGLNIPGIQQEPGLPPYPEVMLESLVEDASALGARYLLAAGDITAEAVPVELSKAGQLLRKFGRYRREYFVTRGNHDRAHEGAATQPAGSANGKATTASTTTSSRGTSRPTSVASSRASASSASTHTTSRAGGATPARSRPTSSPGSAPSSPRTGTSRPSCSATTPSSSSTRRSPSRRATRSTPGKRRPSWPTTRVLPDSSCTTPGIPIATSARSARSRPVSRTRRSPRARSTPAVSRCCACTPAGFALNFYKTRSDLARAWSERSRQEINGAWPQFALGSSVSDRNTVVEGDLSGLRPIRD